MLELPVYSLRFSGRFDFKRSQLFDYFTDLTQIHMWDNGMLPVEGATRMREGSSYIAKHVTAGQLSVGKVMIAELIPDQLVRMINTTGLVSYDVRVTFDDAPNGQTQITCEMKFSLPSGVLPEAQEVAEEMAEARIRANWVTLATMLAERLHPAKPDSTSPEA